MAVVVTGCAGFIGSHLCNRLLKNGEKVLGFDNFDPFYSRKIKENNIDTIINHPNFHFFEVDVRSEDFSLAVSNNSIDTIFHLSARAGVRPSLNFPQSYVHHDVEATVNLLETSQQFGISNIIFGSSSSVYGNIEDLPYSEDMKLQEPISPYAAAKLSCEMFNHVFYSQYGINISNLRFFTVYGPRQRPEMGIHKFVRLVDEGNPIEMYGDGTSSRDYTYIDDILDGIMLAYENIEGYHTYNLGNSTPVKLKTLIDTVMDVMDKETEVIQKPMQPGDVDHTLADISKAQEDLGYEPKISIREGISKFVDWYYS